ncbi:bifunctional 3-(3-hydroxy-phenyl)propionate/3-hydroxycinnamic acid hydroxylase [Pseudomonas chlororaphis]|uniref:bifunctional 3-(3-hydroxy-phenyl)propionate/3-hydroxycinnamic acid hydroxylase MhpA n=1 Tax=Pseudomonas chlororaphis TaxID=587753 RepID=UPI000E0AF787|nr:bifunctional 3-(3-hydroxy-phenyl)propionate/3-hydroxycinnamic acid hydroxylase [Pseudomonas chlororaphis]AZD16661.1 2-polyprenyl-6-methoxyphenol hydroxylase-like [Pseudomonas chlororaphis]WDH45279.1 bifunctional 3-(3-hydroxy-phenyl)propionate/3-hydroxycinnamic acid hydroxylase [Pseudomonas chlororaphis]WDH57125.1 bifunctional 3-(3-hydroxy-phenyl)propionate/3-hydroxycinnamic acid hydroxylase [Pseudomonas chlororaphis]WQE16385.1 bifunctional 3-(3-hydroxy-phenyl)propionate/3-hydroxycinnamic aci
MNNNKKISELPSSVVDVLVIGNGPVGATIAALLGRYGVTTLVVDKLHEIVLMPRAIALDNEALRILQLAGLSEEAFEKIVIVEVKMHSPVLGQFGRANTEGCIDGHPKLVTFYQPDLERAMRGQVSRLKSVSSLGGFELESLVEEAECVVATVRDQEGHSHSVRAQYLIGADGASSRVRALIGQEFEGQTYAEDWLIVDAKNRHQSAIDHIEFICDPRRPTPHMPAPGGRERWEFMLQPGESREELESPESIARLIAPWVNPLELEIERKAVYRFHARCCNRFSKGRTFLVGDAAHITPPFVGQGLVAGLRDGANLAWKLAWVLRGHASPAILETYDTERRPHAQAMINLAKLMGRLVMPKNKVAAFFIHGLMRMLGLTPSTRRYFEQLDIKPKNIFKQGLFVQHRRGDKLVRGSLFPQAWIRTLQKQIKLSDDALGDNLTLVGFGVDPLSLLTTDQIVAWEKMGGHFLEVRPRGQRSGGSCDFIEDMNHEILPLAAKATLVAVRPDRIIMHHAPGTEAGRLLRECQGLLMNDGAISDSVSITISEPIRLRA